MRTPRIIILIILYNIGAVFNKNIDKNNGKLNINVDNELRGENRGVPITGNKRSTSTDINEVIHEVKAEFDWTRHANADKNGAIGTETLITDGIERSAMLQDEFARHSRSVPLVDINIGPNREKINDFKLAERIKDNFKVGQGKNDENNGRRIGVNVSGVNYKRINEYMGRNGVKGKETTEATLTYKNSKRFRHHVDFGRRKLATVSLSKKTNQHSFEYELTDLERKEIKEIDSEPRALTMNHRRVGIGLDVVDDNVLKLRTKRDDDDDDDIPWIWSTCPDGRHYEVVDGRLNCVMNHLDGLPCEVVLDDRANFKDNKCPEGHNKYRIGTKTVCLKTRRGR